MKKLTLTYIILLGLIIWVNLYMKNLLFAVFSLVITLLLPLILSFFINWISNKLTIGKILFVLNLFISFTLVGCIGWYFYNQKDSQEWILEANWNKNEKRIIDIALTQIKQEIQNPETYKAISLSMDRLKNSSGQIINYKIVNKFTCVDEKGKTMRYEGIIVIDKDDKIIESKIITTDNTVL
jgi:ABC-type sugar transport system permease subunit